MERNREGYLVDETHRECTICGYIFVKTNKMSICKSCNTERVKTRSLKSKMLQRAKERCKKSGLEFSITADDIVIPDTCPILGIKLKENKGRSGAYKDSPSLDRIDNTKGYIPGNVQVISQLANAMKGAATDDELILFANWVLSTRSESNESG